MKKLVIFLQDFSAMGGVEMVTLRLINVLICNFDISILSLSQKNASEYLPYPKQVRKILIPFSDEKSFKLQLSELQRQEQFDICINQVQNLNISAVLATELNKHCVKIISILHNSPFLYKYGVKDVRNPIVYFLKRIKRITFGWFYNRRYLRNILDKSNKFVCISENCINEFKLLGFDMKKTILLYNLIDSSFVDERINSDKENIILFAGRFSPEKNLLELLEVWKRLEEDHGNWSLQLIGEGIDYNLLVSYIHLYNLKDVKIIPKVSDIRSYISKSKIAVLNSFTEGLPTFLIESAIFKNVLLGRDSFGGTRDVILDGFNGFLFGNKSQLEQKLRILMTDPILLETMKDKSHYVEKFYDDIILEQWKKLLKEI
ncbi:glycosyltransferase [Sphingobacterium sp. HMSC13C05]|uniref:glycosyltransferase n=1 Tax=Sphingobacterium TaxID=28453 RepID=UPI0008A202B9|nr:glycosyltransferase [Sphingobacterium sp. HMSC13C05]OFV14215.1 hypothetical protein HMPREF3127_13655 [Sphingobacterium sp. HMSC13C05]